MADQAELTRAELTKIFQSLHEEYRAEMEELKRKWLQKNNHFKNHQDCYEVMRDEDRKGVQGVVVSFEHYIITIAEAWWKTRGWTLHWPTELRKESTYTKDA